MTIAADASTRRRYLFLATLTSAWLLESFRQAPAPQAIVDARAIRDALRKAGYTSRALGARVLGGTPVLAAPTQVLRRTPEGKAPPRDDEVDALIALFALGLSVEKGELSAATYDAVAPLLAEDMTARCMVAPVGALRDAGDDLYVLTDWPPEKKLLTKEEPCMYLGPDSLALADVASFLSKGKRVADLCAGSGIQGLVAARAGAASIRWVEAEARAAAFCRLNGALNCVEGDVVVDRVGKVDSTGTYDLILANPPYVATPPSLAYEAFAAGGPDGYDVLKDVVTYASKHLAEDGLLACVFELNGPPEKLFAKVALAWASGGSLNARCCVVHDVLTERTSPEAVAERRGGAQSDAWLANYRDQNINCVANAVLLLGRTSGGGFDWAEGACARAWAPPPSNVEARAAVDQALAWVRGV